MRNTVQTARKPEAGKEPTEARTEGREQNEPEPQTRAVVSDVNALCRPKTVKRVQNQDPHHGHRKSAPGRGRVRRALTGGNLTSGGEHAMPCTCDVSPNRTT